MTQNIFKRDHYVSQLIVGSSHSNILVVTGLRKVGKSTLVRDLFLPRYKSDGKIPKSHVIRENLSAWRKDDRTLDHLKEKIEQRIQNGSKYLVFLDEIQMIDGDYPDYLKSLALNKNVLICLTGSNSHGLSTDIADSFGDRAFPIPVFPLSYKEILEISPEYPFDLYCNYGGLPDIVNMLKTGAPDSSRRNYLDDILDKVYIKDIYDHDTSLKKIGQSEIRSVLTHFSANLTTEISIKKTIQTMCDGFNDSRKRVLTLADKSDIGAAFANLISDYEKSYLSYVFEEDRRDLTSGGTTSYKEQKKLYIADQGLLHQLASGSDKLNANLLENLVYLELKHAGLKPRGLSLTFVKDGKPKNGQVDFVCQNDRGTNIYIQVVYALSEVNLNREIDPLMALEEGTKLIVFHENRLLGKNPPKGIAAIHIKDFCSGIEDLLQ